MTVKKSKGTALSLIVLIVAIMYLLPVVRNALPYEVPYILGERMNPGHAIGSLYPLIVKASVWLIVVAGALDAILRNKVALGLLSSFSVPIVMGVPVAIAAFIPRVDLYLFWAMLHIAAMIGLYWTFRKIIRNNCPGGQKMIPFVRAIKDVGGAHNGHAADHYTVWATALLLLAANAIVTISFLVFVAVHWGMLL